MNELALFAGAGGGILGGHLLGWTTKCAVEINEYCTGVLLQRQNEGFLPAFPIWDDVSTFDGNPWRGHINVVSGGFPCQDISCAGKAAGIEGSRSGLWSEMARIIGEVQPEWVFIENSPMLTKRGLSVVISDLAKMGYDAEWGCISASDCSAPHKRERIWIVGHTDNHGHPATEVTGSITPGSNGNKAGEKQTGKPKGPSKQPSKLADPNTGGLQGGSKKPIHGKPNISVELARSCPHMFDRWPIEPDVGRVADGVAARVDRLKALGNGQVPRVAATAFTILKPIEA